jgi:hypothetical protein
MTHHALANGSIIKPVYVTSGGLHTTLVDSTGAALGTSGNKLYVDTELTISGGVIVDNVVIKSGTLTNLEHGHITSGNVSLVTPAGDSAMDETEDVVLTGIKGSVGYDNSNDLFKHLTYGLAPDEATPRVLSLPKVDWNELIIWTERGIPILAPDETYTYWQTPTLDVNGSFLVSPKDASGNKQVFETDGKTPTAIYGWDSTGLGSWHYISTQLDGSSYWCLPVKINDPISAKIYGYDYNTFSEVQMSAVKNADAYKTTQYNYPMAALDRSDSKWYPINHIPIDYTTIADFSARGFLAGGFSDVTNMYYGLYFDENSAGLLVTPVDTSSNKQVFTASGEVQADITASTKFGSDNAIGVSCAGYSLQSLFEATTDWNEGATGTDNLTTSVEHRGPGTKSLEFDKIAGGTTAWIYRTIDAFDMSEYSTHAIGHCHVYISDLTNVAKVFVQMGTDSSNYWQYDFDDDLFTAGWNDIDIGINDPTSQVGNGANTSAITYFAFGVVFDDAANTLADIRTGGWGIKRVLETTAIVNNSVDVPFLSLRDWNSNTKLDVANGGTYNYLYNRNTDGTNLMPTGDADARAIYVNLGANNDVTVTGSVTNLASDNQIGGVFINGGDGAKNDTSLTLTLANTAYSNTAPAAPHVLIVHNASDTDVYWRFTTGATLGTLLESGKSLAIDMGASEVLYFYCASAGKIVNYSTRCNF